MGIPDGTDGLAGRAEHKGDCNQSRDKVGSVWTTWGGDSLRGVIVRQGEGAAVKERHPRGLWGETQLRRGTS
jgi:hypothetical protein